MDKNRLKYIEIMEGLKDYFWKSEDSFLKILRASLLINYFISFLVFSIAFDVSEILIGIAISSIIVSYIISLISLLLFDFYIQKKYTSKSQSFLDILQIKDNKYREWCSGFRRIKVALLYALIVWGVILTLANISI